MLGRSMRPSLRLLRAQAARTGCRTMCASTDKVMAGPGDLLTWGDNSNHALGHGEEEGTGLMWKSVPSPRPVEMLRGAFLHSAAGGPGHSAAVTASGDLYTWGKGEGFRLGHGVEDRDWLEPAVVEGMRGKRVKDVSCGEQHTACVDGEGHVYTWGFGGSFFKGCGGLGHGDKKTRLYPTLVDELAEEQRSIVQVSCGSMHTVALDSEGFVWTWGKGEYGRLGLGSSSDSTGPELVELLADLESVVQVAASGSFTLALTSNGQVYGWGKNDQSQLGIGGDLVDMFSLETFPRHIEALGADGDRVVHIAAGEQNAACCTQSGRAFYWGSRMWNVPHELTVLSEETIVRVACGRGFYMALNDKGELFTWGKGFSGQLGRTTSQQKQQPAKVTDIEHLTLSSIACGGGHGMAIVGSPPDPLKLS